MRRRKFIAGVGSAGLTSLGMLGGLRAQEKTLPVVGFLETGQSGAPTSHLLTAFLTGMGRSGFQQNISFRLEYYAAETNYDRLTPLVVELIKKAPSVIVTSGPPAALAAKASTQTIPILFVIGYDPVEFGLVQSLNRPGGNISGATFFSGILGAKRLELMCELFPGTSKIGVLVNPNTPTTASQLNTIRAAALLTGVTLHVSPAVDISGLEASMREFSEHGIKSIIVGGDSFFFSNRKSVVAIVQKYALNAVYDRREYVETGGLISYGTSLPDAYLKVGNYCARILRGEMASELPVQQATTFELVINLRTAKALGIEVPPMLLVRADEVIE